MERKESPKFLASLEWSPQFKPNHECFPKFEPSLVYLVEVTPFEVILLIGMTAPQHSPIGDEPNSLFFFFSISFRFFLLQFDNVFKNWQIYLCRSLLYGHFYCDVNGIRLTPSCDVFSKIINKLIITKENRSKMQSIKKLSRTQSKKDHRSIFWPIDRYFLRGFLTLAVIGQMQRERDCRTR